MPETRNRVAKRASPTDFISHWPKLIENLKYSPQEFYAKVEAALAERQIPDLKVARVDWKEGGWLSARREYLRLRRERLIFDICGAPFGTGFFVSIWCGMKPLRLAGLLALFIIAAAGAAICGLVPPYQLHRTFGFREIDPQPIAIACLAMMAVVVIVIAIYVGPHLDDLLIHTPIVGFFYERYWRKETHYRTDRMCMYQQAVDAAVWQVIDEITKAQSLPPLSEFDRLPIMRGLALGSGTNGH